MDELHREEPLARGAVELAEANQISVAQVGQGAELLLEAVEAVFVERTQRLDRDRGMPFTVERLVDHTHAARPQPPTDFEALGAPKIDFLGKHGDFPSLSYLIAS